MHRDASEHVVSLPRHGRTFFLFSLRHNTDRSAKRQMSGQFRARPPSSLLLAQVPRPASRPVASASRPVASASNSHTNPRPIAVPAQRPRSPWDLGPRAPYGWRFP